MDNLLTVPQVAERLQVHPETVREYLRNGTLEGIQVSRKSGWRITEAALQRYYARFGPDAEPPVVLDPEIEKGVREDAEWSEHALAELEKQPRTRQVRKLLRQMRAHVKQGRELVTTLEEIKAASIVAESEEFAQAADRLPKQ